MTAIIILGLILLVDLLAIGMVAWDMWRERGGASMLVTGGFVILLLTAMAFLLIAALAESVT